MQSKRLRLATLLTALAAITACDQTPGPVAPTRMADESAAFAKQTSTQLTTPITGTIANAGGTFTGTFAITKFITQNGQLLAVGTLTGTLTNALGAVIGTVSNLVVNLPVNPSGTCQILHLELGPLDLDLLGLQVHLDRVVLDITAQSGTGNLLGNLLCSVAHLLNNPSA